MKLTPKEQAILKEEGWKIVSKDPAYITKENGSIASGDAVAVIMDNFYLKVEIEMEELKQDKIKKDKGKSDSERKAEIQEKQAEKLGVKYMNYRLPEPEITVFNLSTTNCYKCGVPVENVEKVGNVDVVIFNCGSQVTVTPELHLSVRKFCFK